MLDAKTLKWLEERKDKHHKCRNCTHLNGDKTFCQYVPPFPGGWCYFDSENQDWQDAAEFEARVAMYLAKSPCLTCPSTIYGNCETRKTARGREVIEACRLKHARLAVEEEMP